jgi:hypothetical protein
VHLTAYTVLKRQLPDCQGKFFESTGGQFLVSAEAYAGQSELERWLFTDSGRQNQPGETAATAWGCWRRIGKLSKGRTPCQRRTGCVSQSRDPE